MVRDMDLGTLVVFGAGLGIVRASLADDTKTTYRSTKTQSKDTKRQGAMAYIQISIGSRISAGVKDNK
jgi:hypothetical protein